MMPYVLLPRRYGIVHFLLAADGSFLQKSIVQLRKLLALRSGTRMCRRRLDFLLLLHVLLALFNVLFLLWNLWSHCLDLLSTVARRQVSVRMIT